MSTINTNMRRNELLDEIGVDWKSVYDRSQLKEVIFAAERLNKAYKTSQKKKKEKKER